MSKSDFTLYFSGTENVMEDIFKFCDAGYRIKGVMVTYFSLRGNEKLAQQLKVFREKYRGKVMIDSGAHAFLFKDRVESSNSSGMSESWHPVSKKAMKLLSSEEGLESYVHEYMDWLKTHKQSYDYAVELDIQKLVGNEKVDEWRKEFLNEGLNILLVAHRNIKEGMDFVHKWKELGCNYFGVGDFDKKDASSVAFIKKASMEGIKLHVFAFTPNDLFKYADWITSVDSTSWLSGEKLKSLLMAQRKKLTAYRIDENPLQLKKALTDKFFDVVGRGRVEDEQKRKRYRFISFWNMWQMQKWTDDNTRQPKYKKQLEMAEKGELTLPDWVYDKDKFGRPKSIYLSSRFNNYRCYSDDTEILTDKGWKLFKDLEREDKVATLEGNELKYVKPLVYYSYTYEENYLWRLAGNQFDLLVTPNHYLYVKKDGKSDYELIKFSELIGYNMSVSEGYSFKKSVIKGNIIEDDLIVPIGGNNQVELVKYKGRKVYSVEVPSHVIYVKRNGKSVWSGNSGVYAKKLMEFALECDNCVVKDTCPVYQPGALCYFTPLFRKLGKNTRNKEQIIRTLRDLIADKMERYQRAKLFEAQGGGVIDRQVTALEDSLIKALETLHTVMYGKQSVGTQINMLNQGENKVQITANLDEALKELAQDYGEDFAEGVRKRINQKGGENESENIQDEASGNRTEEDRKSSD